MTREEIFENVKKCISEECGIDAGIIKLESSLQNDLGCDSLDAMTILLNCEDTYGISIDVEEAKNFLTVKDVVDYVEAHI